MVKGIKVRRNKYTKNGELLVDEKAFKERYNELAAERMREWRKSKTKNGQIEKLTRKKENLKKELKAVKSQKERNDLTINILKNRFVIKPFHARDDAKHEYYKGKREDRHEKFEDLKWSDKQKFTIEAK